MQIKKCIEPGCHGDVFSLNPISLDIVESSLRAPAYPCNTCRRLYYSDGSPVFTHNNEKVFAADNGGYRVESPPEPEYYI